MPHKHVTSLGLYTLSFLLISGSNFATAPLLLSQLGVEGYAKWAQLEPLILIVIPLAGLGINVGYLHAHGRELNIAGRILPFHFMFATIISLLAFLIIFGFSNNFFFSFFAGIVVLCEGVIVFFIAFWRSNNQPGRFAIFEGGRSFFLVLILSACILANLVFPATSTEYLALRAGVGIVALVAGYSFLRWPLCPDWNATKRAIEYGFPIILTSVCVVIIMNFDRYGVLLSEDATMLAAYVGHVKIVQILSSALAPFFAWFAPLAISRLKSGETNDGFLQRSFLYFTVANLCLSLGLWLITPVLWPYVFPTLSYDPNLMLVLLVGTVIFACGNPLSIGTLIEGRTSRSLLFTTISGSIGFLAIVILAPLYGVMGVATGKLLAMLCYSMLFARDTHKTVKISYNWLMVGLLMIVCLSLAVVEHHLSLILIQSWIAAFLIPILFLLLSFLIIKGGKYYES